MNDVAKFFEDNVARINSASDPLGWNLNNGLFALCRQLDRIESNQRDLERRLQQIEQILRVR